MADWSTLTEPIRSRIPDDNILGFPPYFIITAADFLITFTSVLIGTAVAFGLTVVGLEKDLSLIWTEYLLETGGLLFILVTGFVLKLLYHRHDYAKSDGN